LSRKTFRSKHRLIKERTHFQSVPMGRTGLFWLWETLEKVQIGCRFFDWKKKKKKKKKKRKKKKKTFVFIPFALSIFPPIIFEFVFFSMTHFFQKKKKTRIIKILQEGWVHLFLSLTLLFYFYFYKITSVFFFIKTWKTK